MKKVFRSPIFSAALLLLAVFLLAFGSVGGTRAALNIESDIYDSQIRLGNISVALLENEKFIASDGQRGDILTSLVGEGESFQIGRSYDTVLQVQNSAPSIEQGGIAQMVRVSVYKYWVNHNGRRLENDWIDGEGKKKVFLDPDLIDLHFVTGNGWVIDDEVSVGSKERSVLYYQNILNPGETSTPFADKLTVKSDVLKYVKETITEDGSKTVYNYAYNGIGFVVEVQVDAVQTHNGDAARISAWGTYQ